MKVFYISLSLLTWDYQPQSPHPRQHETAPRTSNSTPSATSTTSTASPPPPHSSAGNYARHTTTASHGDSSQASAISRRACPMILLRSMAFRTARARMWLSLQMGRFLWCFGGGSTGGGDTRVVSQRREHRFGLSFTNTFSIIERWIG